MPSAWTPELISRLQDFWEKGFTCKEIAIALGNNITRSAVMGKVDRLKLSRWRHNAELALRPPKPKRAPAPPIVAVVPELEPLLAIGPLGDFAGCLYMPGDPASKDEEGGLGFQFCGHPKKPHSSYCSYHHPICNIKPTGHKIGHSSINLTARAARQFR